MLSLTAAVCDDNETSLSVIEEGLRRRFGAAGLDVLISTFSSARDLYDLVQEGSRFDLYFLDIEMPGISGLELAAQIRKYDAQAGIMFISGKEEAVFEAIRYNPFRFVRKSHFKEDLTEAVGEWVSQSQPEDEDYLSLEVHGEQYRFRIADIRYIQAQDNYLEIYTEKKKTLIRYKISAMQELLEEHRFIRIHKSYLVNFRYIYRLNAKEVLLEGGGSLPVSRSRQNIAAEQFREYVKCS